MSHAAAKSGAQNDAPIIPRLQKVGFCRKRSVEPLQRVLGFSFLLRDNTQHMQGVRIVRLSGQNFTVKARRGVESSLRV